MTTPHDEPTPETDALINASHDVLFLAHERLERERNQLRTQLAGLIERAAKVGREASNCPGLGCQHIECDRGCQVGKRVEAAIRALANEPVEPVAQPSRDWPEDFAGENGNYLLKCLQCGNDFRGYKRRCYCKVCAVAQPEPVAWLSGGGDVSRSRKVFEEKGFDMSKVIPLYAAPIAPSEDAEYDCPIHGKLGGINYCPRC